MMFQQRNACEIPNFDETSYNNLRNIDIAIPVASKNIPGINMLENNQLANTQNPSVLKTKKCDN